MTRVAPVPCQSKGHLRSYPGGSSAVFWLLDSPPSNRVHPLVLVVFVPVSFNMILGLGRRGYFASHTRGLRQLLRCRYPNEERMSSSRRARVFRASEHRRPSLDVLQFAPCGNSSPRPPCAIGPRWTCCNSSPRPPCGLMRFVAPAIRSRPSMPATECEWSRPCVTSTRSVWLCPAPCVGGDVSDGAGNVMESARNVLRPSKLRDAQEMFNRPKFARTLSRGAVSAGFQMCSKQVAVIPGGGDGLCPRIAAADVDAWDFEVTRGGGSRRGWRAVRKPKLA